ncbi:jg22215 [Pararge aegeria aegeria]|uniref:Jg22215 protein n=1 Tax=Pararge aegeria aegeria TaxID=348720 RepID=A0A8S4R985_9NEOP|nr:jg22215 [Pararge aegeria aegeria]
MFCFTNKILIIFALISETLGVGIDYYIDQDNNPVTLYTATNVNAVRRTLESNRISQTNISVHGTLYSNYKDTNKNEDIEDGDIIVSYNIEERKTHFEKSFSTHQKTPKNLEGRNRSIIPAVKSAQNSVQTTLPFNLNSFEEYDYKNFNDKDDSGLLALRHQVAGDRLSSLPNKTENDTPYAKFYNLEPAVNQDLNLNMTKYMFDKTWYVPQEFPCWDLPILYGELGAKKNKYNVFLIYGGNLVNVIESSTEKETNYKPVEPQISHVINKWCEVEPCYGDHTLCIFPSLAKSNICDKQYTVHVPSILDQSAVVNTINTMRNHIANGISKRYPHLPSAANMKQVTYDYDLEDMAEAWLRQCLPGSAPCSALDGNLVSHLECTKYAKYCCTKTSKRNSQCTPRPECYVYPIIGCIHIWFSSAGKELIERDVQCGRSSVSTFHTVQLLWAKTSKIGCAFGERSNGDIRVVCNFSPGAPFYLETKLYCGIIAHNDIKYLRDNENLTDIFYLASLGIKWHSLINLPSDKVLATTDKMADENVVRVTAASTKSHWGVGSLTKLYKEGWVRKQLGDHKNGTRSLTARLVAKYTFIDETESRCDTDESIYIAGRPGSLCVENGRVYKGLCYGFRDPTPGYRLIAILASIALFSLILYDLFSGVVRQTA